MVTENGNDGTSTESTGTEGGEAAQTEGQGEEGEAGSGTAAPAAAAVAYTPNFKFKYRAVDKSEAEGEVDNFLKAAIRDADSEKKVRELYEKAHGLDFVKSDRDRLKGAYEPLEQNHAQLTQSLNVLSAYVQNDDLGSFFQALNIPKEQVLKYALQQVQLEKMSPEQRAQFENQRSQTQERIALQMQNAQLTQQFEQVAVQQRTMELDGALGRPEVSQAARDYDQRVGRPGAFKAAVIQRGQFHALSSGMDAPAEQVVQEIMGMLGIQPQAQQAQGQGNRVVPAGPNGKPPVIPRMDGKGTSPAKKVPKSVDDLRKLAAQMESAQ